MILGEIFVRADRDTRITGRYIVPAQEKHGLMTITVRRDRVTIYYKPSPNGQWRRLGPSIPWRRIR